jgi:hypothetical protein
MGIGLVRIQRVLSWLEKRSRWSTLRTLGQSSMVRASVLTPAFGYLLLLNENVRQYLTIQFDAGGLFHYLPSMWRVWMLYYGSFILAIGSIFFASRCPVYIKQYASAFQMADAERHHRTAHHEYTELLSQELKALYDGMSEWENSIFGLTRLWPNQANLGVGQISNLKSSDQWSLGLIHIWSVNDIKRPWWRIATLLLFTTGLCLLAVPAILTFVQVTFHLAFRLL